MKTERLQCPSLQPKGRGGRPSQPILQRRMMWQAMRYSACMHKGCQPAHLGDFNPPTPLLFGFTSGNKEIAVYAGVRNLPRSDLLTVRTWLPLVKASLDFFIYRFYYLSLPGETWRLMVGNGTENTRIILLKRFDRISIDISRHTNKVSNQP